MKKMNSKLKELEREKESLRRKTERLINKIRRGKQTTTKLTPKRSIAHHLRKQGFVQVVLRVSENSSCTGKCSRKSLFSI